VVEISQLESRCTCTHKHRYTHKYIDVGYCPHDYFMVNTSIGYVSSLEECGETYNIYLDTHTHMHTHNSTHARAHSHAHRYTHK